METKNEIKKACFEEYEFFMGKDFPPFRDAVLSAISSAKKNEFQEKLKTFLLEKSGASKAFLFNSVEEAYYQTLRHIKNCSENAFFSGRNEILFLSRNAFSFVVPEIFEAGDNIKSVQADHVGNFISALSEKTCAVVIELFSLFGDKIFKKEFLEQVSEICAVRNVALIVDERNTAPMFTGEFFAFTEYGIRPDAVITGGVISRSFSLGAVLLGKKIKPLPYKKEVGAAAAAGTLSLYENAYNLKDIIIDRSKRLYDALSICKKVKSFSVCGLKGYAETEDGKKYAADFREKGLKTGVYENRILFNVPIGISEEEFSFGISVILSVLKGAVNPFDTDKTY